MKEKKSSLRFSGRKHSRNGVISCVISGIAWCIFLALSVYSSGKEGKAELFVGGLGLLDAVFAGTGMWLAWKGMQQKDVYYVTSIVGMAINGALFIVFFILYFMGVAIG